MKRAVGRVAAIRRIEERKGEAGRWVLITELEKIADKEEILERRGKRGWKWGVGGGGR